MFKFPNRGISTLIAISIIVLCALVVGGIVAWQSQKKETPLSTIAEKIQEEQVEKIIVYRNNIEVVLKDGAYLYSKKEAGVTLSESLTKYGVTTDKLKNIQIIFKQKISFGIVAIFVFLLPFFVFVVSFVVYYFLILLGFRILKIEMVPRSKILVYIFAMFLLGLLLSSTILPLLEDISNRFIFYSVDILISFSVIFLLLRYYFRLSEKKLWQFLLYLVILNLVILGIITFA